MFLSFFLGHLRGITGKDHCSSGQKGTFFSAITNVHYFSFFMESYSAQRIESIPHFFRFLAIFLWSGQNFGASRVIITFTEESARANMKYRV